MHKYIFRNKTGRPLALIGSTKSAHLLSDKSLKAFMGSTVSETVQLTTDTLYLAIYLTPQLSDSIQNIRDNIFSISKTNFANQSFNEPK